MPAPEETTIGVDFAYTSTKYRKPDLIDEAGAVAARRRAAARTHKGSGAVRNRGSHVARESGRPVR